MLIVGVPNGIKLACARAAMARKVIYPATKVLVQCLYTQSTWSLSNDRHKIAVKCGISRSTVYRYLLTPKKHIHTAIKKKPEINANSFRAKSDELSVVYIDMLRKWEAGNFTAKRLLAEMNIPSSAVSVRTMQRHLNRLGYRYVQARKKAYWPGKIYNAGWHLQGILKQTTQQTFGLKKLDFFSLMVLAFTTSITGLTKQECRIVWYGDQDWKDFLSIVQRKDRTYFFNSLKKHLRQQLALDLKIAYESVDDFANRIRSLMLSNYQAQIDNTISSVTYKCIDLIIKVDVRSIEIDLN